jgi:hypothetical protein
VFRSLRKSWRRWSAALLCVALAPSAVVVPGSPAAAACGDEAASEPAAVAMAVSCGRRVEIASERSETSLTYANPDRTLTSVISPLPVRVKKGTGWVAVDTTLVRGANGEVTPRAVSEPLVLSGGGDGPLLTFGKPGRRISLRWPGGALPAAVLDGATVTYPEVLPGVDLKVEAGVASYRQLLVVKTREAAVNPALRRVSFGVTTDGLSLRAKADGGIDATDATGNVAFASAGAFMWDSPSPAAGRAAPGVAPKAAAAEAAAHDPTPPPHRSERMPVQVSPSSLAVVPVAGMLTAADTVYPVYIDPAFSKPSPTWYTNVMDDSPNRSYYGDYSELRVGRAWQTSNVWRAHMQFDITELGGSMITYAELSVTANHTAACGSTNIQLWQTQFVANPGTYTWYNDSDGDWAALIDTKPFSANESSCPRGDDENVFSGQLKSKLQGSATAGYNAFNLGLRAANESDDYQWTRFHGNATFLTVTYNRKPGTPTDMAITECFSGCPDSPVVSRKDPQLSVFATDPDPNTILTVYFRVQTSTGTQVASGTVTGYASGPNKPAQPARWRVTPLLGNGSYRWQAQTRDEQGAYSPSTGWQYFRTDTAAPLVPLVVPWLYKEDDGSGASYGGIGQVGTFLLRGDSTTKNFRYSLDGGPVTEVSS